MAISAIPTNFVVQQGNLQVLATWNIVAGATSYIVQRSTDGVTYVSYATPSVNSYLDTVVTAGVQYFYKVASVSASGTSAYTSAQSVVPTTTGEISLGQIREMSKQRADRTNSNFVTLPEWNTYINQAYFELYDLLTTEYEDYYVAPALSFNTDGSSQLYPLPDGILYNGAAPFYKLIGVDLGLNTSSNAWVTIRKFNFVDRNNYIYPNTNSTIYGVFNMRYRLLGNNIEFTPIPSSGQPIRLWYIPRMTMLLADTDIADGVSGWLEYVIVRAAKYALDKEESDSTKLDAELLFLKSRIEESSSNRDAGMPDTISDIRQGAWGDRGGSGWDGPIGGY